MKNQANMINKLSSLQKMAMKKIKERYRQRSNDLRIKSEHITTNH